MRPQFEAYKRIKRRAAKIVALEQVNTPEARKARKDMNVHHYGKGRMNLNGFYGTQIVRGKEKRKARKIRNSKPFINAVKAGY